MKRSKKRKGMEEPDIMCGLCAQSTVMWMSTQAPPQVMFDSLSCFVANIVSNTVVNDQQAGALEYVLDTAKGLIEVKKMAGRLN